jgi:ABC-type transport system involved in cytochrome c biogenesis permease subunit
VTAVITAYGLTSIVLFLYLFTKNAVIEKLSVLGLVLSAASHLVFTIILSMRLGAPPVATMAQAANMMILAASFFFVAAAIWKKAVTLGVFFAPFATFALSLISGSLCADHVLISPSQPWLLLHTISVIAGDALFIVSGIVSAVYLVHDGFIKRGSIHNAASTLPPLTLLDGINAITLSSGFVAISAGMVIGGLWASVAGISLSLMSPKIATGAVMWLVFAFTLHQRFAIGWRGRRTAIITLCGFIVMAVFFLVVDFIYPGAHGLRILP